MEVSKERGEERRETGGRHGEKDAKRAETGRERETDRKREASSK